MINKKIKYLLAYIIFICASFCSFAQPQEVINKIDSLRSVLNKFNTISSSEFTPTIEGESAGIGIDTTRVNTLNALAWELKNINPDTAIILSKQALKIAEKLSASSDEQHKLQQRLIAIACHELGVFYYFKGNYPLSLDFFFKALKIRESLNNKERTAATLGNIGNVYDHQGNYPQALNYHFKALKIDEELGNKAGICRHLGNIGLIYSNQKDYAKALDYYFKGLKIANELNDKSMIAPHISNIGGVYSEQGNYSKALDYYFKALKIAEEQGNRSGITLTYTNIGTAYDKQARAAELEHDFAASDSLYRNAFDYYSKALEISEELGDKDGITLNLCNMGSLYISLKKFKEAELYLQKARILADTVGALGYIAAIENSMSELYEKTNQPEKALEHYKKYITARDSIYNEENTKKSVRSEMNFEFETKQATQKAEQEKADAIAREEKEKQKVILILISCFLIIVLVFAGFMFNRWRLTQKQKAIIEKQKEKIVDSINYAQHIQQSILIEEKEIQKMLPNSFIYFQPKDIVSGDFYWFSGSQPDSYRVPASGSELPAPNPIAIGHQLIIAAVDCTGHGVPGAFMSMIGNTLLNQIVNEKHVTKPSEILRLLHIGVYEALHQEKNGALSGDGMDIALCCIDFKNKQLQYAGAQNPLYIITGNETTIINADRQTIGGISRKKNSSEVEYTNHTITIKEGMNMYIFTDGYMDQFGSKNRKKFGTQQFTDLLLNNQHLTMQEQKQIIASAHQNWKEAVTQTDDILVLGIKL